MSLKLTKRENEIVDLVLKGLLYKEVAYQLGISERTVSSHIRNIFSKRQVSSRSQLIIGIMSTMTIRLEDFY